MDFGHLSDIDAVDFSLPPLPPRIHGVLEGLRPSRSRLRVRVGCPAWSQRAWIGKVYPRGAQPADFLALYSEQFDAIELNTTHYQIPEPELIERWRNESAEDFRFCPKFPQPVSHAPKLTAVSGLGRLFCERVVALGPKLGLSFLQLPLHFEAQRLLELAEFLKSMPETFPISIEFRHPSWFEKGQLIGPALDALERLGIASVITDVAGRRDVSHQSLTAPRTLVRFIGNAGEDGLHPTDLTRLEAWAERIAEWDRAGLGFKLWEPRNEGEQLGFF